MRFELLDDPLVDYLALRTSNILSRPTASIVSVQTATVEIAAADAYKATSMGWRSVSEHLKHLPGQS
jgi:hypothetical protein